MVNIEFFLRIVFIYTAVLTLVAIARARFSALRLPCLAVVTCYTSLPLWVIFAYEGCSLPLIQMAFAAKMKWCTLREFAADREPCLTPSAIDRYGIGLPFAFAFLVAKIVGSYGELIGRAKNGFSAFGTGNLSACIQGTLSASARAVIALVSSKSASVNVNCDAAASASALDSVSVSARLPLLGLAHARIAAIVAVVFSKLALLSPDLFAASVAGDRRRGDLCQPATLTRAEIAPVAPVLAGRSLNHFAACTARHFGLGSDGGFRTELRAINVCAGYLTRSSFDFFAAGSARNLNSVAGLSHKKHLLLVIDRMLIEGIRTRAEGVAILTECALPVNKCMPSIGVLYHILGVFSMTEACNVWGAHGYSN